MITGEFIWQNYKGMPAPGGHSAPGGHRGYDNEGEISYIRDDLLGLFFQGFLLRFDLSQFHDTVL